jgi:hypothetical protein
VERRALVVEHHVVGAGNAHDEVDAGRAQQHEQRVHVVLVGLGVVGVADVAAHRHAEQLAAEVVFEPGADDLLAVVQVFRADEADHRVDQQRLVARASA